MLDDDLEVLRKFIDGSGYPFDSETALGALARVEAERICHKAERVGHKVCEQNMAAEIKRLQVERDSAREECGHEKAMRKFGSTELSGWIKRCTAAETRIAELQRYNLYAVEKKEDAGGDI